MNKSALFHYPFEQGLIDQNYLNSSALVVNVPYDRAFEALQKLTVIQNYRYDFDAWEAKEHKVAAEMLTTQCFRTIFCQIPQSKEYSLYLMAQCFNALEDDGVLICTAGNNENGKRLKKWFESFGVKAYSESKQKQRIVWAYKKDVDESFVSECLNKYGIQQVKSNNVEYTTKPGVYGWNKIDNGSQLLINRLPDDVKGCGADFGCGYGFLSLSVLDKDVQSLDLIDADYSAIECAKENLKYANCQINYLHLDLTKKIFQKKYDFILMNPPFHQGKETNSDIGIKFIENASVSLKENGMLYMVANNFLPYEKILEKNFKNVHKIIEQNGFKVLFAQK